MADLEQLFADMHEALGEELLRRIQNGEATAAELSVARQFLKDNGIEGVPSEGTALRELDDATRDLPDFSDGADNVTYLGS